MCNIMLTAAFFKGVIRLAGPRALCLLGSTLLLFQLSGVELKLLALQDIAVAATRLTRARGDGDQDLTSHQLLLDRGVQ